MAKKLDNESVAKRNDKGETPSTVEGRRGCVDETRRTRVTRGERVRAIVRKPVRSLGAARTERCGQDHPGFQILPRRWRPTRAGLASPVKDTVANFDSSH